MASFASPISAARSIICLSIFGGTFHPFMSHRFSQSCSWKKSRVLISSSNGGSSEMSRIASPMELASAAATTDSRRAFTLPTAATYSSASAEPSPDSPDSPAVSTRRLIRPTKIFVRMV